MLLRPPSWVTVSSSGTGPGRFEGFTSIAVRCASPMTWARWVNWRLGRVVPKIHSRK
jgi:hypothetical protein